MPSIKVRIYTRIFVNPNMTTYALERLFPSLHNTNLMCVTVYHVYCASADLGMRHCRKESRRSLDTCPPVFVQWSPQMWKQKKQKKTVVTLSVLTS